jgi:RecA-family ATPase
MAETYPDGFGDWPHDRQNAFFKRAADAHDGHKRARPNGAGEDDAPLPKLKPIRFVKGAPVPELEWTVSGWIPKQEVTLVQGDGGLGKSTILQQLQTSCAVEKVWLGHIVEPCSSVGFYTEDRQRHLEIRQAAINAAYGIDHDQTTAMALFPRRGEDNELVVFDRAGMPELTRFYRQVREVALDYHAGLVALDVAVDLFGGDEIRRRQVRAFVRALNNLADAIDGSVVLTGHVSAAGLQSDGGHSGSTDWSNAIRSRLYLGRTKEKDGEPVDQGERILTKKKANYASVGDTIELQWRKGVFLPAASPASSQFRRPVEDVFLALLDAHYSANRHPLSESKNAGNFAPKVLAGAPPNSRDGYGYGDFTRAMETLFKGGKITSAPYGRASDERRKIVRNESTTQ